MEREGTGRACGKIILLGEHAVVYGQPALAAALGIGTRAIATPQDTDVLEIRFPGGVDDVTIALPVLLKGQTPEYSQLALAFDRLLGEFSSRSTKCHVTATVETPVGAGLGSSASMAIAILRAVASLYGQHFSQDEEIEMSLTWENVFHGNPSGLDSSIAAKGALGWFSRDNGMQASRCEGTWHFVVANSGSGASTQEMVGLVAQQMKDRPEQTRNNVEAIGAIVRNGRLALADGDQKAFGQLMDMNHMLLSAMMLSTPELETLRRASREAGALGSKLTGSGGGGCVIALAKDAEHANQLCEKLQGISSHSFVSRIPTPRGGTQ